MKKHKNACSEMQIAHWIMFWIKSDRSWHFWVPGHVTKSAHDLLRHVSAGFLLEQCKSQVISLYAGIRWKTSPSSDVSTWLKVLAACRPTYCEFQWPEEILTNSNESYSIHHAIDFRKPSIVSCSLTFIFSHYFIIHPISYWIWAPPKVAG